MSYNGLITWVFEIQKDGSIPSMATKMSCEIEINDLFLFI